MRTKILVIDDEEAICEILRFNLQKEGYEVDTVLSAEEALKRPLSSYSLFIVDIMMEKMNGFDFVGCLKNMPEVENTPVIFCSALVDEDDKVMGLNIGADDYVTKPFNIPEFRARVRAVLRRSAKHQVIDPAHHRVEMPKTATTSYKGLFIDGKKKICAIDGQELQLTRTEYDMLLFFISNRGNIFSREEIIARVWGDSVVISNRTIDTNITRLRKKLGEYGNCIVTRQGFGYGFRETN